MNVDLATPLGSVPMRWGNVFTTLLIPQRSLLAGLPIAALVLLLLWIAANSLDRNLQRRALIAAGICTGALPLVHAHGFLSLVIASIPIALVFFPWAWAYYFIPAVILSIPQVLFLRTTPVRQQLFAWFPGWKPVRAL